MLCRKIAGCVNSVDPDETPHSAASHLGLHCLLRPVCPNTYGKYGNYNFPASSTLSQTTTWEKVHDMCTQPRLLSLHISHYLSAPADEYFLTITSILIIS